MSNKQKTAFITGGTKGIGLGIAQALLAADVRVAITGRQAAVVEEVTAQLNAIRPGYALGFVADVRDFEAQKAAVDGILAAWGRLDYVIANAGVGHFAPAQELTLAQWQETIDVNLTGAFYTAKASLDALKATEGYYISVASLAGTNFFAAGTAYNASKFGLVGFTQALMMDLRKEGIKVTTLMPGSVATFFNGHTPSETDAWKIQPEDIGQIVVDLIQLPARTLPSKVEIRPSFPK